MSGSVAIFVERDLAFSVRLAWDDRPGAVLADQRPQGVRVIALVAENVAGALELGEQFGCGGDVVDVARGEQELERAADHVGQGVDFGCVSAAREADLLRLSPFFPPNAERWAFT